ncbi:hypothetical protein Ddye_013192 [Dipteronia dyeriana]|uniref:DUF1985 domain-containing protein n=1 Tax=Dipteronia dyeriana TaxID=168575 RepID=A0AAE0CJE3_9ROSI|nr:hypothetical protein Ddye_013192 [Dipteronia dyeriana]
MRPSRNEEVWAFRHFLHHPSPSRWSSPLAKSKRKAHSATEAPLIVSTRRSSLVVVAAIHHSSPVNRRRVKFCHHILLRECHVRDVDDTASTLWFYVGNEVIRNLGPDNNVSDDDMVKLALVLFLEMTLVGKDDRNAIMYWALQLVDDLDAFNSFPWGTFLYGRTFDSLSTCVVGRDDKYKERLESPAKRKAEKYNVYGFVTAFQVWAIEAKPKWAMLGYESREDIDNVDGGAEKICDDCKDDIQHSNVGYEMKKEVNPTSFKKDQGESKKGWKRLKEMEIRLKKMQTQQDEYWQKVRDEMTSIKNEMRIGFLRLSELICKSNNEKVNCD